MAAMPEFFTVEANVTHIKCGRFEADITADGTGSVTLDGKIIEQCTCFSFSVESGEPPVITLSISPHQRPLHLLNRLHG